MVKHNDQLLTHQPFQNALLIDIAHQGIAAQIEQCPHGVGIVGAHGAENGGGVCHEAGNEVQPFYAIHTLDRFTLQFIPAVGQQRIAVAAQLLGLLFRRQFFVQLQPGNVEQRAVGLLQLFALAHKTT